MNKPVKDAFVGIRMTDKQKEVLLREAAKEKMNLSELMLSRSLLWMNIKRGK